MTEQVDQLAAIIRHVDGGNRLGAAALAEAILSHPDIGLVLANSDGPAVPESREPASVASNPSDRAIRQLYCDTFGLRSDPSSLGPAPVKFARAVLARWGHQPAPELGETAATAAEGEVAELVAWLRQRCQLMSEAPGSEFHLFTRAAELLQQLQAEINRLRAQQTPVPVSERLPGPEDLSAKLKFCWWWNCMLYSWAFCDASYCDHSIYTHWRPAHALPLPEGEVAS